MTHAIRVHETGGPEVLRWEEVHVGEPGAGEVRIRQQAVGLNFIDVYHRTGLYKQPRPFTPGVAAAGIIDAVGDGVSELKVGDRVAYGGPVGAYAEVRLIAADRLVPLPDAIAFDQAAGMMLQGMTAEMLVRSVYPVKAGDTILVHAAAGGVGLILCQWASAIGAAVIGTVSTDDKAELARANGCDHPIIYTRQDFVAEVARITNDEKVAVVYDGVGKDTFMKSLDCLRRRGMMASFGNASGPVDPIPPTILAQKGSLFLTRPTMYDYTHTATELQESAKALFAMVESGKVRIDIKQRFALADAAEAHRALEARKTSGSTILTV